MIGMIAYDFIELLKLKQQSDYNRDENSGSLKMGMTGDLRIAVNLYTFIKILTNITIRVLRTSLKKQSPGLREQGSFIIVYVVKGCNK